MDSKATNPKQAFGDSKAPVSVVPETLPVWDCLGFLEGALKYGRANWRVSGVQVSTYVDAFERHANKFRAGEWADPETQVPHLVSARACLGIILDAFTASMYPVKSAPFTVGGEFLTDDRPPSIDLGALEKHVADRANHLRQLFKDKTPRHCTIADTYVLAAPPSYPPLTAANCGPAVPGYYEPPGTPTHPGSRRCGCVGKQAGKGSVMCSLLAGHAGQHRSFIAHQIVGVPLYAWDDVLAVG